MCSL
jgi:putative transposase